MKTFSKIAVLFPLFAAACGGAIHTDFRAAPKEMECALTMDASSNALQVQKAVAEVLEGKSNPCGNAADLSAASVSLARIDRGGDGEILLVFHVAYGDSSRTNVP